MWNPFPIPRPTILECVSHEVMACHGISHECGYGMIVNGEASQGQDLDSMLITTRERGWGVVTTRKATISHNNLHYCFLGRFLLLVSSLLHDKYFGVFTTLVIVCLLQTINDILRAFRTSRGATVIVVVGFVCIFIIPFFLFLLPLLASPQLEDATAPFLVFFEG